MYYHVSEKPDYTIVFAGITGSGKSTAGNFFFRESKFIGKGGLLSVTEKCSEATSTICDKKVKIIDSPGFFDGLASAEDTFNELSKAMTHAKDGIHAVAFVMKNNRYTEECEKAIEQLLHFRGLQPFIFVLLTYAKNIGVTKAKTDEYIQQTLSDERCPPGFKSLMQLVNNHVIMLDSVNTAEYYHEQKCDELMVMMENIKKANGYKIYTNSMFLHANQMYEKAKLQQLTEIRIVTNVVELNGEKIQQLKRQLVGTMNNKQNEAMKIINNEILTLIAENEVLQDKLDEIKDKKYLEMLTNKILEDEMSKSKINARNIVQFTGQYIHYLSEKASGLQNLLKYDTIGLGALGGLVGGGIGAILGSIIPRSENLLGTQTGKVAGYVVANSVRSAKIAFDGCKPQ